MSAAKPSVAAIAKPAAGDRTRAAGWLLVNPQSSVAFFLALRAAAFSAGLADAAAGAAAGAGAALRALASAMRRLCRVFSLAWRTRRRIFLDRRLSFFPMGRPS